MSYPVDHGSALLTPATKEVCPESVLGCACTRGRIQHVVEGSKE